ncbi:spore germination protein [Paenibacillus sp. Marseille-Q4541]|uniref:spore germination protein n=1 Tax=Paenibacillus sp. Marseille-Q4541 TaxID=2831522 RepID=UPI001BAA7CDE|nr:spore germination protein [Paenibacillus sp. Marseille-Q4541]
MSNHPKDEISTVQAAVIIISYMLGAGVLTLPRTTAQAARTPDVWISVIVAAVLVILAGLIIVHLGRRFPGRTFFEFTREIVGKWIAFPLVITVIGYFLVISAFETRVMAEVTSLYLLEGTPMWAIIMVFMWIGFYLMNGGINSMARLFEVILPITLIIFVIIILLSLKVFEFDNLRPVLGSGVMPVLKGIKPSFLSYAGYEILLVLLAFMNKPSKGNKALILGTCVPLGVYLLTLVMVIGGLSVDGVISRTWPTLDLMRSFEMQGLLFERFESLLLVIWIMQMFATFTITHYAASLGLAQLFKGKLTLFLLILLPINYIIMMLPKDVNTVFSMGDFLGNCSLVLFGGIPLLLLIVSVLRKKGVKPK